MQIARFTHVNKEVIEPVLESSLSEGYGFVQKLLDEYLSGVNCFDQHGATLLGVWDSGALIGIGGVHPDTYLNQPEIGRIRHVYVLPAYRRSGVGRQLMQALITHARQSYHVLTLRTLTPHGDAFYKSLGFSDTPRYEQATHWLELKTSTFTEP